MTFFERPAETSRTRSTPRHHRSRETDLSIVAEKDAGSDATDAFLRSTLELVATAVGADSSVAIAMPDAIGRLRVVARSGRDGHGGRLRSARRRQAFGSGRLIVTPGLASNSRLAIIPLIAGGESLGVVEVVAPARTLQARLDRVSEAVDRSAARLRSSADGMREPSVSDQVLQFCSALLRTRTKAEAVAATVEACGGHIRAPIAGALPDRSGRGWFVAATSGLGKRRAAQVRAALRDLPQPATRNGGPPALLGKTFSSVLEADQCRAVEAGPAVLLVAGHPVEGDGFIAQAAGLLATALTSERHTPGVVDVGIGWTAHELRTPVLSARAAIDHVLGNLADGTDRDLLTRARGELGYLAELVEPLLYWAAGSGKLRRRRSDLVRLVHRAVASCTGDEDDGRLVVEGPDRLLAWVDGGQLRGAVANLVRNALAYSPADTRVSVTVLAEGDHAEIRVGDRGPGIPAQEREHIFQPFARGRAGGGRRTGGGLGLFIAKRIVEAHGGTISVGSEGRTTSFRILLPLERRDLRRTS